MLPPERKANVYELAVQRLDRVFRDFDNIYVSFSGGKDSGALLNMCIDYIRRNGLKRKIGVYHMDYEVQYAETTKYVERMWADNADVLEVYHVCVPFKVPTCTSMFQTYWRPWDDGCRELWVREMPAYAYTKEDFEFYKEDMWDYDFQMRFAEWLHRYKRAARTCCLVGIRTQESFNRWRTIYSERRVSRYKDLKWTNRLEGNVYNAYVMYDWLTTDVWTANGKFGWDYNHLYDLYYMAGVPLEKQRVASPFLTTARESLHLYRAIDPDMWGKMICRVNGVNFTAIYGRSTATGRLLASPPPGHTWESYMNFLLSTLPQDISDNYRRKLAVSIDFWRSRGGCLEDDTIQKLRDAGIQLEVVSSSYRTRKKAVKMEYMDDMDIAEFKDLPTFKRICICILKNDHTCRYMGFSPTKEELLKKERAMQLYNSLNDDAKPAPAAADGTAPPKRRRGHPPKNAATY